MKVNRALTLVVFTLVTVALLTGCAFKFRSLNDVPPALRTLYLDTPNPYSPLTTQLKRVLKSVGIRLTETPQEAPVILRIIKNEWTYNIPPILASGYATTYSYTLTTTFELRKRLGKQLRSVNTFTVTRSLIQNANQVYTPNATQLMKRQITRTMVMLIYEHLTSKGVRCTFNKTEKTCQTLLKKEKKKIKKKRHDEEADSEL